MTTFELLSFYNVLFNQLENSLYFIILLYQQANINVSNRLTNIIQTVCGHLHYHSYMVQIFDKTSGKTTGKQSLLQIQRHATLNQLHQSLS